MGINDSASGGTDDMARIADTARPNVVLYNLRDALGASQQDIAAALNRLATMKGSNGCVTANQVSRWERGITRPSPFYRQLLSEHFGVSVNDLGLSRPRPNTPSRTTIQPGLDTTTPSHADADPPVLHSQRQWRETRRRLNASRGPLARQLAALHDPNAYLASAGLLTHADWLPPAPVPLQSIRIEHDETQPEHLIRGTDHFTNHVRPLIMLDRRFHRYSQAIRILDHPKLFENRIAWSLQDVAWSATAGHMSFGDTTYFESVDVCEALAHEAADALLLVNGTIDTPTWRGLTLRRHIEDPFDLGRRAVGTSTDTLTIRKDRDGATFILHDRDAGSVAVAGGMLHVMPCGIFQPSSIRSAARMADFDLWRNIMREYSEEFLGNPEHDGDGAPIHYGAEPFHLLNQGLENGKVRAYCFGVALDALTLHGEILTVVVFDGTFYDELFRSMVDVNDEGSIVKTGLVHPTPAVPFTSHTVRELIDSGRMAPAAAGCLQLAWDHRRALLTD